MCAFALYDVFNSVCFICRSQGN
uniref:Uncharacterized protein n=1 Tax=Anguilla anguilla TaxID=7936 RepID=A0A0E9QBF5_ANGAN